MNNVWRLVLKPHDHRIVRTKCVFKNKFDKQRNMIRNEESLFAMGNNQIEWIDLDETFGPIVKLVTVYILLTYSCHRGFKLLQMDVNYISQWLS